MGALLATALLATGPAARRPVTRPLAGAILGSGLAAPFLLPFLEYLPRSAAWAGVDRHVSTLPLRDLLRFGVSSLPGSHPIEAAAYLSLAALPLALAGAFAGRKERDTRTFVVASALLLVAAFTNPLSDLLASASTVRWSRTLLLLPIPAALLAARGLDALAARAHRAGRAAPLLAIAAGCAAELLSAARGVHAVTPERPPLRTPILDRLAADPGTYRVLPLHTFLPANTATSIGLDDLRGYDALAVRAFRAERERVGLFRGVPTHTDVVAPGDLVPWGGRARRLKREVPPPPSPVRVLRPDAEREARPRPRGGLLRSGRDAPPEPEGEATGSRRARRPGGGGRRGPRADTDAVGPRRDGAGGRDPRRGERRLPGLGGPGGRAAQVDRRGRRQEAGGRRSRSARGGTSSSSHTARSRSGSGSSSRSFPRSRSRSRCSAGGFSGGSSPAAGRPGPETSAAPPRPPPARRRRRGALPARKPTRSSRPRVRRGRNRRGTGARPRRRRG